MAKKRNSYRNFSPLGCAKKCKSWKHCVTQVRRYAGEYPEQNSSYSKISRLCRNSAKIRQTVSNVHQWSYGRLTQSIPSKAAQIGIVIEQGQQPVRGSPQDKAKELPISTYHLRLAK
ncbi:hypothetical protein [Trichormus azollae]|uniref:hypothetical protein n=1 Tax=Trichormus azollae TaxID=1164 RepID=UPI00325FD4C2